MPNFIQICLYIIEKILENRQKRPNLGTRPVRYDLPNGFTYLQLGKDLINLFYLNICHLKTIHRKTFLSFWIFDFINKIENVHFIYI